jgi:hypothetical protein
MWTLINRMTKLDLNSGDVDYKYRADGMQVRKTSTASVESVFYAGGDF